MTFSFEKREPLIVAGPNWSVLEYLVERFNRPRLEGTVFLRRTMMRGDLQLCLVGECCGNTMTVLSESFADDLLLDIGQKEQLVSLVSRFLLKVKDQHRKLGTPDISL